jgi:hypothetical protein
VGERLGRPQGAVSFWTGLQGFDKPFTRVLSGFYNAFARLLQSFYKAFATLLQCFKLAFHKAFAGILQGFHQAFISLLQGCYGRFLQSFLKAFTRLFRMFRGCNVFADSAWLGEMSVTPCGTRAHNLRIRSPTPCPLGQGGLLIPRTCKIICLSSLRRRQGYH